MKVISTSENFQFSFGKRSSTTQTDGSARWRAAAAAKRDRSAPPPAAEQRRSNGGVYENESIDFHRAREVWGNFSNYRVAHLVANLGWVDLNFDYSTVCLILPGLMGVWQKRLGSWARWWNSQIQVNQTQVRDQTGHPVQGAF